MPSKTRSRAAKSSKENIGVVKTTKLKASSKVSKVARKPLGDKTNSASDDNISVISEKPNKPVASAPIQHNDKISQDYLERPRRARCLPTRYKESETLKNLSNSNNVSPDHQESPAFKNPSPVQKKTTNGFKEATKSSNPSVLAKKKTSPVTKVTLSPKSVDHCSNIKSRPRRVCRLPSKFEDHSISPNKYIPLQPINASTPLAAKSKSISSKNAKTDISAIQNITPVKEPNSLIKNKNVIIEETCARQHSPKKRSKTTKTRKVESQNVIESAGEKSPELPKKRVTKQRAATAKLEKVTSDTNNNAKKNNKALESPSKSPGTPGKIFKTRTTNYDSKKNNSIRLLDDKNKLKRDSSKLDPYEFTFDPNEETPPPKKKKKKPAPRKTKPKTVTIKTNYDKNLAKALAALKKTVNAKHNLETIEENGQVTKNEPNIVNNHLNKENVTVPMVIVEDFSNKHINKENEEINGNINYIEMSNIPPANEIHKSLAEDQSVFDQKNYNSVRVEDIARDFLIEDDHIIDYSPVNSPRPITPVNDVQCDVYEGQAPNIADPLNLRGELSFFDDVPVASSSMNVSVRNPQNVSIKKPQASPWRAEFGSLPIKWQVNTYVKPNMTPAYESSFINFNESKKKHVYANMVLENDDPLPQVENNSNLKQTSIISFIKEVVEKKANKKNKLTPVKANSLFEDLTSASVAEKTPNKVTPLKNSTNITPISERHENGSSDNTSNEKNTHELDEENSTEKAKTPNKNGQQNNTYFGFDSLDIEDQENVSPIKKNSRVRALRSRTRGILQEINEPKGPTRANLPVAAKSKPALATVTRCDMKSATEPPVFPEVAVDGNSEITNVQETCVSENLDNDESVHLFEDIDMLFIHHPKVRHLTHTFKQI